MRLTTKGRFAVTAMLDIALCGPGSLVSLAEISKRRNISLSYLEQLFARLRKGGLVESSRGPGGGYRISLPIESISVAQVIRAVDEPIDATQCGGRRDCTDEGPCLTHELWQSLNEIIYQHLSAISLADVIKDRLASPFKPVLADHHHSDSADFVISAPYLKPRPAVVVSPS